MWQLIAGPILGVVGGLMTRWLDIKAEKQKAEERDKERGHELAIMDKEFVLAERKATHESDLRIEEDDAASFGKSYEMFTERIVPEGARLTRTQTNFALGCDMINRLIRPLATIYYQLGVAVLFSWAAWELHRRGVDALTTEQLGKVTSEIIYSIIAMAETTLFWWFGIRGASKRGLAK